MLERLDRGRRSSYSAAEREEIERLYFHVMGRAMRVSSCPNRWADAVLEIKIFLRKNNPRNKTMKASKYIMKRGVILRFEGKVYSFASITDEVAEKALKENPNISWMFASIPAKSEEPEKQKKAEEPENAVLEPEESTEEPAKSEEPEKQKKAAKKAKK